MCEEFYLTQMRVRHIIDVLDTPSFISKDPCNSASHTTVSYFFSLCDWIVERVQIDALSGERPLDKLELLLIQSKKLKSIALSKFSDVPSMLTTHDIGMMTNALQKDFKDTFPMRNQTANILATLQGWCTNQNTRRLTISEFALFDECRTQLMKDLLGALRLHCCCLGMRLLPGYFVQKDFGEYKLSFNEESGLHYSEAFEDLMFACDDPEFWINRTIYFK